MKLLTLRNCSLALVISSASTLSAQHVQPWSGFEVHDKERPHPAKVETKGAVSTPAPKDAEILFDGKNTDAFTKAWEIVNGVMVAGKLGDTRTKKDYGSCQFHIEWKIPKDRKIRGQMGGNSGIFFMDRYEIQILESHTNKTYADGQAGSLYGQHPPLVNASTAQGEWQSYDIIFTAPVYKDGKMVEPAKITAFHNGVLIHNNQTFKGKTSHKVLPKYEKTHPLKAPIRIQWHGDPIEFRNIWVRDLDKKKAMKPTQK